MIDQAKNRVLKIAFRYFWRGLGFTLIPLVWYLLKAYFQISDRYLPSFREVFGAINDIEPNIFVHLGYTAARLLIGFGIGTVIGIFLGLMIFKSEWFREFILPTIQSLRAVPAIAVIPFMLLWFGFSEAGKYLLVICGTSFNLAVATFQIATQLPEKYKIMFRSFGLRPQDTIIRFALPFAAEQLLPTLRFSLSVAIGLILASELLGSQVGLGYLIQTSLSTFSLHVIFLVTALLGIMNIGADRLLCGFWNQLIYWKK